MSSTTVLLATEGTYPYGRGGVGTWCDQLVRQVPDTSFQLFAVTTSPYVTLRYDLPANVERVITVPLWGFRDPAELRLDRPFAQIFLRKQRTTTETVAHLFIPLFTELIERIVHAGEDPDGMGRLLASLYRYLQAYDYEESFKSSAAWEVFRERSLSAVAAGVWPDPTVFDLVQAVGWVFRFLSVLNVEIPRVDLVHSSAAAFCGIVGIVSKVLYATPYLLTEHGVYLREQYLSVGRGDMSPFAKAFLLSLVRAVVKTNFAWADEIAPVCDFNTRWERRLGAEPGKIRVIYNGISTDVFDPGTAPEAAPAAGTEQVLCVGRIDPNKDQETLLRAAALVHAQLPGVRFLVQGAISVPEYHKSLVLLRQQLGLEEVVEFAPHTDDIVSVYRAADIVVQSSVTEAFPYAVIEAMMMGKPLVATEVGGTAEAVADTGLLVPARDATAMAEDLIALLQDSERRRALGRAARERAIQLFDSRRATHQYHSAYQRLLGRVHERSAVPGRPQLALVRAYALAHLGEFDLARRQFDEALRAAAGQPSAPAILASMAGLEGRRGRIEHQIFDLVRARLLDDLQRAG